MRAFPCYFLLVLALFWQPTTEDEQKGLAVIVPKMQQLKGSILDLDVLCKKSVGLDIGRLRDTATKLDSTRAHVSDKLSLYSSRAGLVGGTMMMASLIPNPLSPGLFTYGSYLSVCSAVGHVSNAVIIGESYNLSEVAQVIQNLNEFYEVMLRVEYTFDDLLKLRQEAILIGKNGRTLSKEMQQKILLEIEEIWKKKISWEEKRRITPTETIDYISSLFDVLEFVKNVYHTVGGGSIDISVDEAVLKAGIMKKAFAGITIYMSILTESKNIEEVLRRIRERGDLTRLLRDIADDMERVCDGSHYFVAQGGLTVYSSQRV